MKNTKVTNVVFIIAGIFIASNLYTMLPIQERLAEQFSISIEQASFSSFSFIFCYAIGLLFFGNLTDQYGEKPVIVFGMLVLSLHTFFLSFIGNYPLFLTGRALQGFLAASFAPAAFSYIFRYFQGSTQSLSIALINTGFLFAGIFGQILSAFFVFSFSLSFLFYAFAAFYFTSFILLVSTLIHRNIRDKHNNHLSTIVTLFKTAISLKLYGITFFLLLTVMAFYGGFEVYLLEDLFHLPMSLQLFRMISFIGILPAFFANKLVQSYNTKTILSFSLLLLTIGFSFSIVHLSVSTVLLSSICMVASTSLSIPMIVMLIGKNVRSSIRGRAISIYSFILLSGASLGSLLAALVPFSTILLSLAALFLGLAFVSYTINERKTT